MLKQEQIRPFLLGALIVAGITVVTHYIGASEGYFSCVGDAIKTYHLDDMKNSVTQDEVGNVSGKEAL